MSLNNRKRVQISCNENGRTKQYFKDECDINNIVQKFAETGQISNINHMDPQYGESPSMDLKEALDMVDKLRQEYDQLSFEEKKAFGHNMNNYAQFLSDYEASPESFFSKSEDQPDTSVSQTPKTDEKTASGSPDGGGRSET